jgi:hypothetical protein
MRNGDGGGGSVSGGARETSSRCPYPAPHRVIVRSQSSLVGFPTPYSIAAETGSAGSVGSVGTGIGGG